MESPKRTLAVWNDAEATFDIVEPPVPTPRHRTRYPGRNRVMGRDTALELRARQLFEADTRKHKCMSPYIVAGLGLASPSLALKRWWDGDSNAPVPVEIASRCRKCAACLAHRRRLWATRARDELRAASRSWFATLTVRPEIRFMAALEAATRAEAAGHGDWRRISAETKFEYLVQVLGEEVTRYWKRLRKSAGVPLRYLLVAEAHKDGFPHFHMLIHEEALPTTKRALESAWRYGFSQFRLVDGNDPRSAWYVSKYLAKDARTRVRASRRYGRPDSMVRTLTERLLGATRELAEAGNGSLSEERAPGEKGD